MSTITIKGELEINYSGGIIYFDVEDKEVAAKYGAVTVLRICGLPKLIEESAIDITVRKHDPAICSCIKI